MEGRLKSKMGDPERQRPLGQRGQVKDGHRTVYRKATTTSSRTPSVDNQPMRCTAMSTLRQGALDRAFTPFIPEGSTDRKDRREQRELKTRSPDHASLE